MFKLENAKNETISHFDQLIRDANHLQNKDNQDMSLVKSNLQLQANIE